MGLPPSRSLADGSCDCSASSEGIVPHVVSLGKDQNAKLEVWFLLSYHRKVKKLSAEPSKLGDYLHSLLIPETISAEACGVGRRLLCLDYLIFFVCETRLMYYLCNLKNKGKKKAVGF